MSKIEKLKFGEVKIAFPIRNINIKEDEING